MVGWALPTSFDNGVHCTPYTKLSTIPKACVFEAATHSFSINSIGWQPHPDCYLSRWGWLFVGFIEYLSFFKNLPYKLVTHFYSLMYFFRGSNENVHRKLRP